MGDYKCWTKDSPENYKIVWASTAQAAAQLYAYDTEMEGGEVFYDREVLVTSAEVEPGYVSTFHVERVLEPTFKAHEIFQNVMCPCGHICPSDRKGEDPCILGRDHDGPHKDINRCTWANIG